MPTSNKNNQDDHSTRQDVSATASKTPPTPVINNDIYNRHDLTFKACMGFQAVAMDFFSVYLPDQFKQHIDLSTLQSHKEVYIDDQLNMGIVDLLYTVNYRDKNIDPPFMYLHVEHQSTSDPNIALRIKTYECQILNAYVKQHPKKTLPFIHSIVFYHGDKQHTHPINFYNAFGDMQQHAHNMVNGIYPCIDIKRREDINIEDNPWVGAMTWMFKYANDVRFLNEFKTSFSKRLRMLIHEGGGDYVNLVLRYLLHKGNVDNKKAFIEYVKQELTVGVEGNMASTVELYWEEGHNEGLQKGLQTGLQTGLQKGLQTGLKQGITKGRTLATQAIAKQLALTGFEPDEITRITQRAMDEIMIDDLVDITAEINN